MRADLENRDTYQVAYFLQQNESHNLLVKVRLLARQCLRSCHTPSLRQTRFFKTGVPNLHGNTQQIEVIGDMHERDTDCEANPLPKKRKRQRLSEERVSPLSQDQATSPIVRRSSRSVAQKVVVGAYQETEDDGGDDFMGDDSGPQGSEPAIKPEPVENDLASLLAMTSPIDPDDDAYMDESAMAGRDVGMEDVEEEEEAPKPVMQLRYAGFTLPDICLALVVQPYSQGEGARSGTREPSVMPGGSREPIPVSRYVGIAPATPEHDAGRDESVPNPSEPRFPPVPLFREETPAPEGSRSSTKQYPPVSLFHEETTSLEDDMDRLLIFSQALNAAGGKTFVDADDGDEDDADALYADADEGR